MTETHTDENGFTVREELPLNEFLNYHVDDHSEYIHMVPGDNGLAVYRSVTPATEANVRIKTVVDAPLSVSYPNRGYDPEEELSHIYLTYGEAFTALTFLNSLKWDASRSDIARLSFTYYQDNGKPMFDGRDFTEESLILEYQTESGNEGKCHINHTYRSPMQRFATWA